MGSRRIRQRRQDRQRFGLVDVRDRHLDVWFLLGRTSDVRLSHPPHDQVGLIHRRRRRRGRRRLGRLRRWRKTSTKVPEWKKSINFNARQKRRSRKEEANHKRESLLRTNKEEVEEEKYTKIYTHNGKREREREAAISRREIYYAYLEKAF